MQKILINTPDSRSEIRVGENWQNAFDMLPPQGTIIITDDNVRSLYGKGFFSVPVFSVPAGEESKTIGRVEELSLKLLEAGIDRNGFILAIGGGVVSDLAGFLSSIYMRGVRCAYISTTLLSQVDASTGGKNGVNLGGIKNMLGTIRQPEFVICDPSMLLTLPEDEYYSGLAELIKTSIIGDSGLFDLIWKHHEDIRKRNIEVLEVLISRAVNFKAEVVSEDEKEKGVRRILNFGHTFGHAIEMELSLKHGFAVAAGMELATVFSYESGLCSKENMERITGMLRLFNFSEHRYVPVRRMMQLMLHDKKKTGDEINFIFTAGPGKALIRKVPSKEILDFYKKHTEKQKQ